MHRDDLVQNAQGSLARFSVNLFVGFIIFLVLTLVFIEVRNGAARR